MPERKRTRIEPTDDWQQLRLLNKSAEQLAYEMIRPVVLFGQSPAERAKATGKAERTIYRKAERFDALGMVSLFEDELRGRMQTEHLHYPGDERCCPRANHQARFFCRRWEQP